MNENFLPGVEKLILKGYTGSNPVIVNGEILVVC
jgi:hypothetical protein